MPHRTPTDFCWKRTIAILTCSSNCVYRRIPKNRRLRHNRINLQIQIVFLREVDNLDALQHFLPDDVLNATSRNGLCGGLGGNVPRRAGAGDNTIFCRFGECLHSFAYFVWIVPHSLRTL